ncbi:MAG: hypothetical protein NZ957_00245 [Thaumarchaeota archaeon]|nr:hypothetical protein [Candidatus Calditenuaceae archaeon]MDW8041207.1 hypothetical protein [Nitrososphaerota archaeon]
MHSFRVEGGTDDAVIAYRCYYHTDHFAVRRCQICSRMMCNRCSVYAGSKTVCKVCYMRHVLPGRAVVLISTGVRRPELAHRVISV